MKTRFVSVYFLFAILTVLLTIGSSGECRAEVVLRAAIIYADAGQLDPHLTSKTQDVVLLQWMFNALVRFKQGTMDPGTIEPDLAEKWTASPDGRSGPFNSAGVNSTGNTGADSRGCGILLQRAMNPKTSAFTSDFAEVKSIEAVNPIR